MDGDAHAAAAASLKTRMEKEVLLTVSFPDTPPTSDAGLTFDTDDGTTKLRVFTSLAALGTPFTVAAQEIRIEYFFPGDKVTEQVFL